MKRPVSLWVFGIVGIIVDILLLALMFMAFFMPVCATQSYIIFGVYIAIFVSLLLFIIGSAIEMIKLKRRGKNTFIMLTILLSPLLVIWLLFFLPAGIGFIIFYILFIGYFTGSSVKKLFN